MFRLAISFILFGISCAADTLITPEEFEEISKDKTLYFNSGGQFHGAEQYFDNRVVTWKFANGECDDGFWYPKDDAICFSYKTNPVPQCWHFLQTADGLAARMIGADPSADLLLNFIDSKELLCKAPYLGA